MFSITFRDMEVRVTLTCPCTCVDSARCPTLLQLSFSPFPSEQNLLFSETSQRRQVQPAWLLQAVPHPFPPKHSSAGGLLTLSRLFCRSAKQSENPSRSTVLTWDGHSDGCWDGWWQASGTGVPSGFHFGQTLSHNMGWVFEHVFETICLAATCDQCCPNRVHKRHLTTSRPSKKHNLLILSDLQHWAHSSAVL